MTDSENPTLSSSPKIGSKNGSTPPQTTTPPPSSNSSFSTGNASAPNRNLLGLSPSDEVVFDINNNAGQNNGLQAKLQIRNIANKSVVFKVIIFLNTNPPLEGHIIFSKRNFRNNSYIFNS